MSAAELAVLAWRFRAMGTTWHLHHGGQLGGDDAALAQRLVAADEALLSRFQPASDVTRVTAGAGRWVRVDPVTLDAIAAAAPLGAETHGAFTLLVGGPLAAWGYAARPADPPRRRRRRRAAAAAARRTRRGRPGGRRLRIPAGTALDLGGIGKSFAAVRVGRRLAALHPGRALLVDAGGDLAAVVGDHAVVVPGEPEAGLEECTVDVPEGWGVATSGPGRRAWTNGDGTRAHHLIDPQTGRPAAAARVTVVADDPVRADVLATALAIRPGLASGRAEAIRVTHPDGRVDATPAWGEVLR